MKNVTKAVEEKKYTLHIFLNLPRAFHTIFTILYKLYHNFGVLQWSILGPLLLIIFVNDLPKYINTNETIKVVDDTKLFYFNDSYTKLFKKANDELHVDPGLLQTCSPISPSPTPS